MLAPLDEAALAPPVEDAARRGIPVVVIDSGLKGSGYVSFVATDNRKGGRLAGDHLAGLLKDAGRVVMLRYAEGSESTIQREEGFLESIGGRKNVEVLSANQYGGADVEGAYKQSETRSAASSGRTVRSRSMASLRTESTTLGDAAGARGQRVGGESEVRPIRCVG